MILLSDLFTQAGVTPDRIEGDAEVSTLVMDSRKAVPGCCFVCMPSESSDSHEYLPAAREGGAVAAIVHSDEGFERARGLGLVVALVLPQPQLDVGAGSERSDVPRSPGTPETPEQRIRRTTGRFSEAMWRLAKVAFGDPSSKLKVIGVTGTNGKTTTAWLIRDMLNLTGMPCAYIGTLGFGLPTEGGEELRELANTTPFTIELNAMLGEAVERGCKAVAMEVSSHALAERRADGVEFDVVVFTNLSQDHLDYHGDMDAYKLAKKRLFSELSHALPYTGLEDILGGVGWTWGAFNYLDPFGMYLMDCWQNEGVESYGAGEGEDGIGACSVQLVNTTLALSRIELSVHHDGKFIQGWAPLGGEYNVWNLLAAITAIEALGRNTGDKTYSAENALAVACDVRPVPGRFEPVINDSGIGIIVDYAHTPDALEKLIETVRPLTKGRIITVFGCGGDRDKGKRPLMGKAAHDLSDVIVVTSDNPRTEDPDKIIDDILEGIGEAGRVPANRRAGKGARAPLVEPDRPAAVSLALSLASPGDTVVIAGKGHENYQIIGRTKYPMDDRDLARAGLAGREQK